MAPRMLSGPDLGAGYLYQLSFEGDPVGPVFIFHAQDGGADASGPPIGPLGFLGYAHPAAACMFGGPRCWERRFALPESALVRARAAYQRTRFCMAAMLGHEFEATPVPFPEGLQEFLERVDGPMRSAGRPFQVVGRGASWLRGTGPAPGALHIVTDEAGAGVLAEALEPLLLEPLADRGPEEGLGGRAFLGTFKAGLRVDFGVRAPGAGATAMAIEEIPWAGFQVPVPRDGTKGAPSPGPGPRRNVAT